MIQKFCLITQKNTNKRLYFSCSSTESLSNSAPNDKVMIILKQNCPEQIISELISHSYSYWCQIISKKWELNRMGEITKHILQWNHSQILQFYANCYSQIYQQIKDINFPYLKYLNTWGNNIQSIECLSHFYFPNLEQICLWDNKIVSLRPLRRVLAPKLNWIDLKKNNIHDHSTLSQFYNPSRTYKRLHVTIITSPNSIVKLEGESGSDIQVTKKQIHKQQFLKILQKRGFSKK